jgi:hypothetical protein
MMNNTLIHNVPEAKNENIKDVVIKTLTENRVSEELHKFERAHRLGKERQGRNRPIVIRYTSQNDAYRVLQETKPPYGKRIPKDEIRFSPQTPEEYRQSRAKLHEMAATARENLDKPEIVFKKDHITVNKIPVSDEVSPPSAEEILLRTTSVEYGMQSIQFFSTDIVTVKNSRFQLFAAEIDDAVQAELAYKAVQRMRLAATSTHLISAYRINDGALGWRDDGDHAMGRVLHSIMKEKKISNCILFMARNFGGIHLGKQRFQIMADLVNVLKKRMWKIRRQPPPRPE